MSENSSNPTLSKEEENQKFLAYLSNTFAEAEKFLEIEKGTLADTNKDSDFIAIMKMASTIEPLINQSLETEINHLRKSKVEVDSANHLAAFVISNQDKVKKAKLARDMGIISAERCDFVLAVYSLRNFYAHNVKNFQLNNFAIIKKAEKDDKALTYRLSGIDKNQKFAEISQALLLRTFVYWRFAGVLSNMLHVLKPPPWARTGLLGLGSSYDKLLKDFSKEANTASAPEVVFLPSEEAK